MNLLVDDDASSFSNFENVGVGTTNRGYVKIGKEIIEYNNVTGNVITISDRGDDSVEYAVGLLFISMNLEELV